MKSLLSKNKECYKCGSTLNLHKHHIFYGRNRQNSEHDGCWVWLCARHHNMSNEGVHFDKVFDDKLKKECEEQWLKYYNKTIDDFINKYKKNYI